MSSIAPKLPTCPLCASSDVHFDWDGDVTVRCDLCGFESEAVPGAPSAVNEFELATTAQRVLPNIQGEAPAEPYERGAGVRALLLGVR